MLCITLVFVVIFLSLTLNTMNQTAPEI